MLGFRHRPSIVTGAGPASQPWAPAPTRAAHTLADLRELIDGVLLGLFPGDVRCEILLDCGGHLVPLLDSTRRLPSLGVAPDALTTAPLVDAEGRPMGFVLVERAAGHPGITRAQRIAVESVAALVSLALRRADVGAADPASARAEVDRGAARRVQRRLMSSSLPPDAGVTAHVAYLPAFDVGGDFYSIKYLGEGRIGAAIGDVCGNGVSAALVMARVASELERTPGAWRSPSAVLRGINESVSNIESDRFVTASCVRLDPRGGSLTVANAGHLPLVVRRADGHAFTCGGASGVPLGTIPCHYDEEKIVLQPSDIVLLMTDGLLEALDHPGGSMGIPSLLRLVREAPHDAGLIHERIRAAVDDARRDHVLDDVTWIELQIAA